MDLGPNVRVKLVPFMISHGISFLCGILIMHHWQIGLLILALLSLFGMTQAWRNR